MLAGLAATQQCFTTTETGGLLASDLDGAVAPPTGEPNYVVGIGTTNTTIAAWRFHVDWSTPANSTFIRLPDVSAAAFTPACHGGTCIPQPRTATLLDSLGDRLMYRLAYRNFGSYASLVVTQSVKDHAIGIRWYELRVVGGVLGLYQQGTYAPDANARWLGSAAMDHVGNIAFGFSIAGTSGPGLAPSLRATGHLVGDPLGRTALSEATLVTGGGVQNGSLSRWGDYASMNIDPTDDCTFWFTSEYLAHDGRFNWSTNVSSFELPGCSGPDFTITATPNLVTTTRTTAVTTTLTTRAVGSPIPITLTAANVPSGVAASFDPPTITAGDTTTLTLTIGAGAVPSASTITVHGVGSGTDHTVPVGLVVTGANAIANPGFESGTLGGWTPAGAVTTVHAAHSGSWAARTGSTGPSRGDSKLVQRLVAPSGSHQLLLWYSVSCRGTLALDWATATLQDGATTTTVLPRTCTNTGGWARVAVAVTAGHTYVLTLTNHDDGAASTPTSTRWDDAFLG